MRRDDFIALYRVDFLAFLRFAFHETYPSKPFIAGRYLEVIADELMRCQPNAAHRLMLNLPPRYLKSFSASIAWPIFMAAHHPSLKICVIAGTRELAAEFSAIRGTLLQSRRLLQIFPQLRHSGTGETLTFANKAQIVQSYVARSQIGRGADIFIIDDPLPARHANNDKIRTNINSWYNDEIIARLSRKNSASLIVVMQRLHRDDLCGHILKSEQNWRVAALSAIAKTDERWLLSNGRIFERLAGTVLCEGIESLDDLHFTLWAMNGLNFRAQYLQQPADGLYVSSHRTFFHDTRVPLIWKVGDEKLEPSGGMFVMREECFVEYEFFGFENPFLLGRDMTEEEIQQEAIIQQRELMESCRSERRVR